MSENVYERGVRVRLSSSFTIEATGLAVDPTTVKLSVRDPAGTVTTYTYGIEMAVIKDSAGHYHYDLNMDSAGRYFYRWWSTGNGQTADEKSVLSKVAKAI